MVSGTTTPALCFFRVIDPPSYSTSLASSNRSPGAATVPEGDDRFDDRFRKGSKAPQTLEGVTRRPCTRKSTMACSEVPQRGTR